MKPVFSLILIAVLALNQIGCTSMQQSDYRARDISEILEVGDHIIVYEKSGRILDMRFVRLDGSTIRGSLYNDGLTAVTVEFDDIEHLEAERLNMLQTTGAVLGGIVLFPIFALGAGAALADEVD